jgi:transposase, IS5 family
MRNIIDPQMKIGETAIPSIQFNLKCRDEIPKLLRGLQAIYCNKEARDQVFDALTQLIPPEIDMNNGRKGMGLWKILVLGTLRLSCNWDYDKLHEIANNHITLRQMLGHGLMDSNYQYKLQTLKDNISLFTPEILDKINQIAVKYGQEIAGKKKDEKLTGSCDSFVVETDVRYPTDINLLFDALRKMLTLIMGICGELNFSDWRQGKLHLRKIKSLFRTAQQMKRSAAKDPVKKAQREQLIISAHETYIDMAQSYVDRIRGEIISRILSADITMSLRIAELQKYTGYAEKQIDLIRRRVINHETIPHAEKIFSLFEPHTEWISKGKAGVPVELGLKVCIVKDQFQFILYHQVMQKQTDDQIAVSIIKEVQQRFPDFRACSFDKGFHSPGNQEELASILDHCVLPRKGSLSAINKEIENSEEFQKARRKHSAVESSINALENHGLDICPDHGLQGFKRYVALAVLARNIQILGNMLLQKELKKEQRTKLKNVA